jgi:hypothetical protein
MDSEEALSLLALAEDAETGLSGPEAGRWIENLRARLGDLRAAAQWFVQHGEPERALRLAAALATFWRDTERLPEGREWMDSLLGAQGADVPSAARAKALHAAGMMALRQRDPEAARSLGEEALRNAWAADDREGQMFALLGLARTALQERDAGSVVDHARKAIALARDTRERQATRRIAADCLVCLGCAAAATGEFDRAIRLLAAGRAQLETDGSSLDLEDQSEFDRAMTMCREGLPSPAVQALWEDGWSLSPQNAVELAMER